MMTSLWAGSNAIPEGATLLTDPDEIVARVLPPRVEVEEVAPEAEAEEEGAEGEAAEGPEGEAPPGSETSES